MFGVHGEHPGRSDDSVFDVGASHSDANGVKDTPLWPELAELLRDGLFAVSTDAPRTLREVDVALTALVNRLGASVTRPRACGRRNLPRS